MREVSRHLFIPRRPLIAYMLASDPERSWIRIVKASLISSTRPALIEDAIFGKRRPAVEIGVRIVKSGRVALRLRLRLIQRGLEVARIDRVKQIAFLDVGAIRDVLLSDIAGHLGLEGDVADRLAPGAIVDVGTG